MEIAGLGIGIAGLAGMFTTCLDVMERIDSYKDFGVDSRAIMSQFDAQKLLFKRWGTAVGFDDRRLQDDHHENLDDAATRVAVQNILSSIYEIAGGTDRMPRDKQYRSGFSGSQSEPIGPQQAWLEKFRGDASHKTKIGWTLRHKARFLTLSQHFGNLVETLHNLVPPNTPTSLDSKTRETLRGSIMSSGGASIESPGEDATSSWYIDTQRILMDIERRIERDTRNDLETWLCGSYATKDYGKSTPERLPGTCDWILNREAFCDWNSSNSAPSCGKILWINGPPGYGKTYLNSRIVELLKAQGQSALAVFFSSDLEDRSTPFIIARHWVAQLTSQSPEAFSLVYEKFELHTTPFASSGEVMDLLKEVVHTIPQCTLVVDGLDEYSSTGPWSVTQSGGIESFIGKIVEAISGTTSRIFVTSRQEQGIRNGLSDIDDGSIGVRLFEYSITPNDVTPDATKLSESIVSENLGKKSKAFRDDIARRLVDRCDSMLLQIRLLGNEIRATLNQKQNERIIDQTPFGTSSLYDRAWRRIMEGGNETSRALAILRWIAFGTRPLTILEITEALVLTDNEFVDNLKDEMPDELNDDYVRREILDICASLVETRASNDSKDLGSRTVHFTHFTVREYVLQHLDRDPIDGLYDKNAAISCDSAQNNKLAEICLRYLIMSGSRTRTQDEDTSHSSGGFGGYAIDSWHKHVRRDAENYAAVSGLLIDFFSNEDTQWGDWRRHHDSTSTEMSMLAYEGEISSTCPLFYASLFGFIEVVEELIHVRGVDVDHVDESSRTGLLAAIHEDKHELMEYYLQRDADINKASNLGINPFHVAASKGNRDTVKSLLEMGADLTIATSNGRTALGFACKKGHLKVVQFLLEKGADLHVTTQSGWTALAAACASGHLEIVRLLLERGADIKVTTDQTETLLILASREGHLQVVELLLEKGSDLAVADKDGWTALAMACVKGHLEIVRLLLGRGAEINITTNRIESPLALACWKGHFEVVELLLDKGGDLTIANENGWTALAIACADGHLKIVQLLLEQGADMTALNDEGCTPLWLSSICGHLEVVKLLLEKDADLTIASNTGWTPLAGACANGHCEITRLLLEWGADLTTTSSKGLTPLHVSSRHGYLEVVEVLLEKGADLNVANEDDHTPLLIASVYGHFELVKTLLDNGADWNAADINGWSPLLCASDQGHVDVIELLLKKGAKLHIANNDGSTPLLRAAENGNLDVVKLLLEKGVDINTANDSGWTPLYAASRNGHTETIRQLLKGGADMSITTLRGWTPILAAANHGHLDAIELLLREGAAVTAVSCHGKTPLHLAADGGWPDVIQLLIRHGADIRAVDEYGMPPLFMAIKAGDLASFFALQYQEVMQPEFQDFWGSNALSLAVRCGQEEMIRALIGISDHALTLQDRFGRTPIWWAAKQGNMDMLERLGTPMDLLSLTNLPTESPVKFAAEGDFCDVCLASVDGPHYKCSICSSGKFVMCLECQDVGAHCLEDAHELIRED